MLKDIVVNLATSDTGARTGHWFCYSDPRLLRRTSAPAPSRRTQRRGGEPGRDFPAGVRRHSSVNAAPLGLAYCLVSSRAGTITAIDVRIGGGSPPVV